MACPQHPGAPTRDFRADGPEGRAVYRFCQPPDGNMHLLGLAPQPESAPARSLAERITSAAGRSAEAAADGPFSMLTVPELEVLYAAGNGLTMRESADALGKSAETIKSQRNEVMLKLEARNMAHAVCIAAAAGLIDASCPPSGERRRTPRVLPPHDFAVITYAGSAGGRVRRCGSLVDASHGGMTFRSEDAFTPGELVVAEIRSVSERTRFAGLRLRVLAVHEGQPRRLVRTAFVLPPPDRWLDALEVGSLHGERRAA